MKVLILLVLLSFPALADDGYYGQGHGTFHNKFYENLRSPKTKVSCCNINDCRPTEMRTNGDHYEVKVNGMWVRVPMDIIVKVTAPDGGAHVCAPHNFGGKPEQLFCVILPPET